jgi:transposase
MLNAKNLLRPRLARYGIATKPRICVECFFLTLKQFRRIATRFRQPPRSYQEMLSPESVIVTDWAEYGM